uniref:Seipin n=1 Tax=Setaria digitata TaxID=48799 RepID=A0A915Q4M0_9BILA
MLRVENIGPWLHNRRTLYHIFLLIFQLFGAFVVAVVSPFLLRQFLLPSLVEYAIPLHFTFETCSDQLAGICSFPTAVVDFAVDNPKLSPGEYYEVSVEIILSESAVTSEVGIFQAVVEFADDLNIKRTFRRSCYAKKYRGLVYRISQEWWNLVCRTLFFPAHFFGLLTMLDDRKIKVSFTGRLVDSDLAKTAFLYVQLQNRFIEVESGELLFKARFGLFRFFLHDYPVISSLLIMCSTYFTCLIAIVLYWILQAFFVSFRHPNSNNNISAEEIERPSSRPKSWL